MNENGKRIFLVLGIIFIFLSGCGGKQNEENIIDSYLLRDSNCLPPYFYGITPGETTKEEAVDILQSLGARNLESNPGILTWRDSTGLRTYFILIDDIVVKISFVGLFQREQEIYLKDAIDRFGHPEVYDIVFYHHGDGHLIIVFYPTKGIIVVAGTGINEQWYKRELLLWIRRDIYPVMRISEIDFIKPNEDLEQFLQDYWDTFYIEGKKPTTHSFDPVYWHGYGDFP